MDDQVGQQYTQYRADSATQAARDAFMNETAPEPQKPVAGQAAPTESAAPAQPKPQGSMVGRVAKDIGTGMVEAPRAIYSGVTDAIRNSYDMLTDFSTWAGDKISDATGFRGIHVGKDGVHLATAEEAGSGGKEGTDFDPLTGTDERRIVDTAGKLAAPSSVTGGLIKGVSQFLTGLALVNKVAPGAALAGGEASYTAASLKGAAANFAAFDPHQQRLSNLIEQYPQLSNPVTQLLQAKPDDTAAEGRFKNAAEGLGLGVLTDGLFKAVKFLGSAMNAKQAAEALPDVAPAGLPKGSFASLGDETKGSDEPLLQQRPGTDVVPTQRAVSDGPANEDTIPLDPANPTANAAALYRAQKLTAAAGKFDVSENGGLGSLAEEAPEAPTQVKSSAAGQAMAPPKTYINFAKIEAPTDIQRAMQELADSRQGDIEGARRGTQSFEQIKLNAQQQDAWQVLKSRREGDPLNAEQSVAARQLWAASAQKLTEVAQAAVAAPTEENLFAFRKMLATHYAIQSEVVGARTETARALASWRIPVGTPESRLQDITGRLDQIGGGQAVNMDLARKVAALSTSSDENAPLALSKFVEKSAMARTRDASIQFFRDALLSGPTTQGRILASNISTALWRMGERKVGEMISSTLGTQGGIAPGEAAAMWSGWIGSTKDAFAYAAKAAKTGAMGAGIGEPHEAYPSMLSGEALKLPEGSFLSKAADFIGTAASWGFGTGGRRGIIAQHDMALTMGYGAELNANAVRQATSEVNAGELGQAGFAERVASLLKDPVTGMPAESIAVPARAGARYQSFLDDPGNDTIGKLANILLDARQKMPILNTIIPFVKIPSRILSFTFERTPLAPLMSDFRSKIAAGGATRDLAMAQLATGSLLTMAAADMVHSRQLKGGGPPEHGLELAEEREGIKNDSIKVGDSWYNINGVHPVGKLMLLAADVAEAIQGGQHELKDDEDTTKLAVGTAMAIGRTLVNASYMQGVANLFATLHDAKVGASGESGLLSAAGSMVPQAVAAADRAGDPYQRAVYGMLDEFKSKIPGLSQTMPPRRDLWGNPVSSGHDPLTRFMSPVQFAQEKHSPIDDEILKQGFNIPMPERNQSFGPPGDSARIDMSKYPKAYSRFLQLAGHEYESPAWGVGAKDLLDSIVSGNHPMSAIYDMKSDGPGGGKQRMIQDILGQYREGAKKQLLDEFPRLAQDVDSKREAATALKLGQ